MSHLCQLKFYNCHTCANDFFFTIFILAPIVNLQLSDLRQLWVYNCYICSNYDFTIVILATVMTLNCQTWADYYFIVVKHVPIKILQLSHLRQLYFYICHTCANCDFTIFILASFMILLWLYLRQLWFYNCQIWATYNFTIVILATVMILNCQTWAN